MRELKQREIMTPISNQFNNALFAINALRSFAQTSGTVSNPSIFGSFNFNTFSSASNPLFSFSSMASMPIQMPTMPASLELPSMSASTANFNFSSFDFRASSYATQACNFGTFGTNVRPSQVRLTTNKTQNAVALAEEELRKGVRENGSSNNSAEVNKYRGGSANGAAWCASFVSWCYGQGQNNNNSKTFGYDASTQSIRRKAERAGYYSKANTGYVPQVGDLVIWKYSETTGHVGIVTKVYPDGSFDVIEGNCGDRVQKLKHRQGEHNLHGFVRMNEWTAATDPQSRVA